MVIRPRGWHTGQGLGRDVGAVGAEKPSVSRDSQEVGRVAELCPGESAWVQKALATRQSACSDQTKELECKEGGLIMGRAGTFQTFNFGWTKLN